MKQKKYTCPSCKGTGKNSLYLSRECSTCDGFGDVSEAVRHRTILRRPPAWLPVFAVVVTGALAMGMVWLLGVAYGVDW